MPTEGVGAIGSLDSPPEERRRLAARSVEWVCPVCCVPNKTILPPMKESPGAHQHQEQVMAEAADIVTQMAFKVCVCIYLHTVLYVTVDPPHRMASSQCVSQCNTEIGLSYMPAFYKRCFSVLHRCCEARCFNSDLVSTENLCFDVFLLLLLLFLLFLLLFWGGGGGGGNCFIASNYPLIL